MVKNNIHYVIFILDLLIFFNDYLLIWMLKKMDHLHNYTYAEIWLENSNNSCIWHDLSFFLKCIYLFFYLLGSSLWNPVSANSSTFWWWCGIVSIQSKCWYWIWWCKSKCYVSHMCWCIPSLTNTISPQNLNTNYK